MLPLNALGNRIMVLGPSNAGKSTLAMTISETLGLPIIHMDQLQHLPNTDWETRSEEEFKALHDQAILGENWVIDGNYSRLMPARLKRATAVILITSNRWMRLFRYLKRSSRPAVTRIGGLEGGPERIKWEMIHWILFVTAKSHVKYSRMIRQTSLPFMECHSASALKALYQVWGLTLKAK